jgi:predicted nucleic acid-binding protein
MIIVDTGFWLTLANKNDLAHPAAKTIFQKLENEKFITTWCVVTETCYLLQKRVGIDAPKLFIALRITVRTFLNPETLSLLTVPCSLFPVP